MSRLSGVNGLNGTPIYVFVRLPYDIFIPGHDWMAPGDCIFQLLLAWVD